MRSSKRHHKERAPEGTEDQLSADDLVLVLESGNFSTTADWSVLPLEFETALVLGGVCGISSTSALCTVSGSATWADRVQG